MNIGGYVKNSFVDYPGKISFVIFTNGCNLRCWYCHNSHLFENKDKVSIDFIFNFLESHKTFLDGIVITGGEPTLQLDLKDFISKLKCFNLPIKLDTNGTNFEVLNALIEDKLIDYVAMDIKAPLEKYEEIANSSVNLDNIKKSIDLLKKGKVNYEFRTTFSPDLTLKDIESMGKLLVNAKNFSLQKFNKINKNKYNENYDEKLNLNCHSKYDFMTANDILKKYIENVTLKF